MTTADLPAPLTSMAIDLDGMPSFMLDTEQLRQSELWAISTGDEFKAAVGLWCRAWLQKPPGSLPNDDRVLASWSGSKRWAKVREVALRGFILCSDGRLYHPVLCADALRAWERRTSYRDKASNAAAARWAKHKHASGMPQALPEHCPSTARAVLTDAQGEGERHRDIPAAAAAPIEAGGAAAAATDPMGDAMAGMQTAPQAPHRLNFADWRIQVGHRCFVGRDERGEWEALFAAEGWDSMSAGYAVLDRKHPKPAKLFLSMFQEIRE